MPEIIMAIIGLYVGLVALSCWFGQGISLNPPEQKNNHIAVIYGVAMTILFLTPSQYLAYNAGLVLLFTLMPTVFFSTSLGIVSVMWFLKHKTEEVSAEAYKDLYQQAGD